MAWTILVEGHQRNILIKYIKIGPVISDKKRFKIFYIDLLGKTPCPWRPLFWPVMKEIVLQNYIEIGPVVSDKKVFQAFKIDIEGK